MVKVSIGIVAYNEEKNIRQVIEDILEQKSIDWNLEHIYVACGGCTDNTIATVKSINSPLIQIFENPKRQGKAADEQKIFDAFDDDILVMFDADVRLQGNLVVEELVQTLINNPSVDEVGGNPRPFRPQTFFEKAVYTTFMVMDKTRQYLHNGNNIYGASGQCIALRKNLVKLIKFPSKIVAEDDFIYFTNKKNKGKFIYCEDSVVNYKLPKNLADYIKQVLRADPAAAIANVEKYFGNMPAKEYRRPLGFYAKAVMLSFLWNPVGSIYMICVRLVSRIAVKFTSRHYSLDWFTAGSTK